MATTKDDLGNTMFPPSLRPMFFLWPVLAHHHNLLSHSRGRRVSMDGGRTTGRATDGGTPAGGHGRAVGDRLVEKDDGRRWDRWRSRYPEEVAGRNLASDAGMGLLFDVL